MMMSIIESMFVTGIRQRIAHLITVTVLFHLILINNALLQFMPPITINLILGLPYLFYTFLNLNLLHTSHTKTSIKVLSSIPSFSNASSSFH